MNMIRWLEPFASLKPHMEILLPTDLPKVSRIHCNGCQRDKQLAGTSVQSCKGWAFNSLRVKKCAVGKTQPSFRSELSGLSGREFSIDSISAKTVLNSWLIDFGPLQIIKVTATRRIEKRGNIFFLHWCLQMIFTTIVSANKICSIIKACSLNSCKTEISWKITSQFDMNTFLRNSCGNTFTSLNRFRNRVPMHRNFNQFQYG